MRAGPLEPSTGAVAVAKFLSVNLAEAQCDRVLCDRFISRIVGSVLRPAVAAFDFCLKAVVVLGRDPVRVLGQECLDAVCVPSKVFQPAYSVMKLIAPLANRN